jgi:hypothetical protein
MHFRTLLTSLYRKLPIVREVRLLSGQLSHLIQEQNWMLATISRSLLEQSSERFRDPRRILHFEFQGCSQNGEDGILHEIFRRVGSNGKVLCEIGCGVGGANNTSLLVASGWRGFWIDGQPAVQMKIAVTPSLRDRVRFQQALVTAENIEEILAGLGVPEDLDLLSIDIDQNTYHVWHAISSLRPRVVVVEYNASIPPWLDWVCEYQPHRVWDGTINMGGGLKAFERLGREKGYSLIGCDSAGVNAYFVRQELADDERFCGPFTAENHHEPPRYAWGARGGHAPSLLGPTR